MAQFESIRQQIESLPASLVYVAAQKRGGMFKPEKFLAEHPVSFPFLLDEDRSVTRDYGVYHRIGRDAFNIAHPATFVVARDGSVRWIYVGSNQLDRAPLDQVLEAAKQAQR
jgi:peroxiredoxin